MEKCCTFLKGDLTIVFSINNLRSLITDGIDSVLSESGFLKSKSSLTGDTWEKVIEWRKLEVFLRYDGAGNYSLYIYIMIPPDAFGNFAQNNGFHLPKPSLFMSEFKYKKKIAKATEQQMHWLDMYDTPENCIYQLENALKPDGYPLVNKNSPYFNEVRQYLLNIMKQREFKEQATH